MVKVADVVVGYQRKRVQLINDEPSMTHQSFKDESDINNIISKYKRNGVLTHVTTRVGKYGDYSNIPSFHEALNVMTRAQQDFDQLPASLRKRFGNDPVEFVEFVCDKSNKEELIKLGLLKLPGSDILDKNINIDPPKEEQSDRPT